MKTMAPPAIAGNLADALDAQAQTLIALATVLRTQPTGSPESKHVDQYSSPLTRRVYLEHARKGAFPTVRCGKRVLAERVAFETWLATLEGAKRRPPAVPYSGPRSIDEVALEELGLRPARGGRR